MQVDAADRDVPITQRIYVAVLWQWLNVNRARAIWTNNRYRN
jgi:hypothetical protein